MHRLRGYDWVFHRENWSVGSDRLLVNRTSSSETGQTEGSPLLRIDSSNWVVLSNSSCSRRMVCSKEDEDQFNHVCQILSSDLLLNCANIFNRRTININKHSSSSFSFLAKSIFSCNSWHCNISAFLFRSCTVARFSIDVFCFSIKHAINTDTLIRNENKRSELLKSAKRREHGFSSMKCYQDAIAVTKQTWQS